MSQGRKRIAFGGIPYIGKFGDAKEDEKMSQQKKPIYVTEFKNQFDEWQLLHATRSKEKASNDAGVSGRVIEVVEKSALDIAVAALKKIHEEDKNPYNHNINGPEKCAICIAKEALKTLGV